MFVVSPAVHSHVLGLHIPSPLFTASPRAASSAPFMESALYRHPDFYVKLYLLYFFFVWMHKYHCVTVAYSCDSNLLKACSPGAIGFHYTAQVCSGSQVCVSALCDVHTTTKSPNNIFLRTYLLLSTTVIAPDLQCACEPQGGLVNVQILLQ